MHSRRLKRRNDGLILGELNVQNGGHLFGKYIEFSSTVRWNTAQNKIDFGCIKYVCFFFSKFANGFTMKSEWRVKFSVKCQFSGDHTVHRVTIYH